MDTKKIATLLRAIELGSYSLAAEELGYSKSAFGYMLKSVESELGISLVEKDYSGIRFSEYGKKMEPYLRSFLVSEEILKSAAARIIRENDQTVRIAAYPSIAESFLAAALKDLAEDLPNITTELQVISGDSVAALVRRGDVDFGFADIIHAGELEWIPLLEDPMCLAVPAAWVPEGLKMASVDLIREHPFITSDYTMSIVKDALHDIQPGKIIRITVSSSSSLLAMVNNEIGITFTSRLNQINCPPGVRLLPIDPPIKRQLGLIARSFQALNAAQKQVMEYLQYCPWGESPEGADVF